MVLVVKSRFRIFGADGDAVAACAFVMGDLEELVVAAVLLIFGGRRSFEAIPVFVKDVMNPVRRGSCSS